MCSKILAICMLLAIVLETCFSSFVPGNYHGDINYSLTPKIINGTLATANATRHQVSVRRKLNDGYFFGTGHICGGSLIMPNVVLSAAHCFVNQAVNNGSFSPADDFIVVMGNLDRVERNNNTFVANVQEIIYAVEVFNLSTYERDLALLILNESVPAQHLTISPIILNRQTPLPNEIICQVTGWGLTEEGYISDVLMTVDVPLINAVSCANSTGFAGTELIKDGMLCAGYTDGERDACSGDSGGPLVCNDIQVGIVSWGVGCAVPNLPGVYTDVAYYVPWIQEKIKVHTNETLPTQNDTKPGEPEDERDDAAITMNNSVILIILCIHIIWLLNQKIFL